MISSCLITAAYALLYKSHEIAIYFVNILYSYTACIPKAESLNSSDVHSK